MTATETPQARYSRKKTTMAGIVQPPPVQITPRRQAADDSLQTFLETYFPESFHLGWSPDHLHMIASIEQRIVEGGLKSIAYPRGSGKTSIILRAGLWAVLTGRRKYVVIVGANELASNANLSTIKTEINFNEELAKDYARELVCLRKLEGESRRTTSQTYDGKHTGVEYNTRKVAFGVIPQSATSGAVIATAGITGQIRGQQATTPEGKILRPDLVLVDDPQTKSSAGSPSQCNKRHEIMMGDVLGMAGPGVQIAGFCTCTVIYKGDLADRLLDMTVSPDWHGDRVALIKSWPKNMAKWDQYNAIRVDELTQNIPPDGSRQFVRDNYDELHEGAVVYWDDRKADDDVSALQHAMDLYFRDQGVFYAEYQNAPQSVSQAPPFDLNPELIARRTTGIPRGRIPLETHTITAFIDVQRELLYYMVVAWTENGRAYVIDYGACPDQKRHYWTKSMVSESMQHHFGDDMETYLRGGLNWLIPALLENDYTTEDGGVQQIARLAIDARWGESTHIIRRIVRESKYRARIHPSMGMYIGATSKPWQKLKDEKRDKKGVHAKLKAPKEAGQRELLYDTNYWKSFAADRLSCGLEAPRAITIFDAQPHELRMLAEHCAFETPVRVVGKSDNEVVEWRQDRLRGTVENDLWDCLVGNCALASVLGVKTHEGGVRQGNPRLVQAMKKRGSLFRSR